MIQISLVTYDGQTRRDSSGSSASSDLVLENFKSNVQREQTVLFHKMVGVEGDFFFFPASHFITARLLQNSRKQHYSSAQSLGQAENRRT